MFLGILVNTNNCRKRKKERKKKGGKKKGYRKKDWKSRLKRNGINICDIYYPMPYNTVKIYDELFI